jgi:anti-anti-sigma factor
MQRGKILVAEHQGAFVIKLVGDVRVTLCVAFDDYVEKMLAGGAFKSVVIDLSEAEGIDSTTLGLLAKVSIRAKEDFSYRPVIISTSESITRLITSMGFDMVFDIHTEAISTDEDLQALVAMASSEVGVRAKVIEAHRVLMGLSDGNRAKFQELVTTLENAGT